MLSEHELKIAFSPDIKQFDNITMIIPFVLLEPKLPISVNLFDLSRCSNFLFSYQLLRRTQDWHACVHGGSGVGPTRRD